MNLLEENIIRTLPKIDLHCHLDGSVSVKQVCKNLNLLGKSCLDEEIQKAIIAPELCKDLTEYLTCFEWLKQSLSNEQLIQLGVIDICRQATEENVIYIELRFSPYHLMKENFSMEEVIVAVIKAVKKAQQLFAIHVGVIVCMMRGRSMKINEEVLQLVKKYRSEICGIDLAGDEQKYTTKIYQSLLEDVVKAGIPLTVHAGETGNSSNISDAIMLGAKRIGHGIAAIKDPSVIHLIKTKQIALEMCPVCNLQTRASSSWKEYPFEYFFREQKLLVTINTDNRTVSNTTLTREFLTLKEHFNLTIEDIKQITLISLSNSFLSEREKNRLERKIIDDYAVL